MRVVINEDKKAEVYTPYNKEFVAKLKKSIGSARWNPEKNCWVVPEVSLVTVREIMLSVYGETDIAPQQHVDVKVTFNRYTRALCGPCEMLGKTVATAYGRDSGAKLGKDVELLEGEVKSGGSMKNWETRIEYGTVLIIRNVVKNLVDAWDDENIVVEVLSEEGPDKEALLKEKESLLKRIEEIDKVLGNG